MRLRSEKIPGKATGTSVPAPSDHLNSRNRSWVIFASGRPLLTLELGSTSAVITVLYTLIFASPFVRLCNLKSCTGLGSVIWSYTYTSRIAPEPSLRTVTSACSEGVPLRLPQLTLSTFEVEVGAIIAVQCAGSFTASGHGCTPSRTTGVCDTVAVAVKPFPPFELGEPRAVGVALPPFPPIPLHPVRTRNTSKSKHIPINKHFLRENCVLCHKE